MQLTSVTLFPAPHHVFLGARWKIFPGEEAGVTVTRGQSQGLHRGRVEPPCRLPSCLLWPVGVRLLYIRKRSRIPLAPGALQLLPPNFLPGLGVSWEKASRPLAEAAGVLLIN